MKRKIPKNIRLNVIITEEKRKAFKRVCLDRDVSMTEVIIGAIDKFIRTGRKV